MITNKYTVLKNSNTIDLEKLIERLQSVHNGRIGGIKYCTWGNLQGLFIRLDEECQKEIGETEPYTMKDFSKDKKPFPPMKWQEERC